MDEAVLSEIAKSEVLVRIELAETEVSVPNPPKPLYALVPYFSYFSSLADRAEVKNAFQHALPPGQDAIWFEDNGCKLRSHYPVGVLHDVLQGDDDSCEWRLQIHFRNFPDEILPFRAPRELQDIYMLHFNALKEAALICRGTAQAIMTMSSAELDALWRSTRDARIADIRSHLRARNISPITLSQRGLSSPCIPVRLLLRTQHSTGAAAAWQHTRCTSRPVESECGSATRRKPTTLALCLHEAFPHLFVAEQSTMPHAGKGHALPRPSTPPSLSVGNSPSDPLSPASPLTSTHGVVGSEPAADMSTGTIPNSPTTAAAPLGKQSTSVPGVNSVSANGHPEVMAVDGLSSGTVPDAMLVDEVEGCEAELRLREGVRVLVAGIAVPLHSPLLWLHQHFHAQDYFLYIVVHDRTA